MYGDNPIRPPVVGDGNILEVKQIFPTLQGEGIFVGVPAVFVRLGGCNLACKFCDTDFEDFSKVSLADIIDNIQLLAKNRDGKRVFNLVVITGGEPFRQNIVPLCEALLVLGFSVQIETNGTLYSSLPQEVDIVCSPKNVSGVYANIRPDLLPKISAFKFIISAYNEKYKSVPEVGQSEYNTRVFVQPMDENDLIKNAANTKLAVDLALFHGYSLSLQTHKLLGIE